MAVETDQRKDFIDFTTTQSKLEVLDDVERKIVHSLALSGNVFSQLSSDRPGPKQIEKDAQEFVKSVHEIESTLHSIIALIAHDSTAGATHSGSNYGLLKELELAVEREQLDTRLVSAASLSSASAGATSIGTFAPVAPFTPAPASRGPPSGTAPF